MNIIKNTIISEKATSMNELRKWAASTVESKTKKIQIKKAVKAS